MKRLFNAKWLLAALLLLCGCDEPAAKSDNTISVTGTVTLDGQPLPTGRIAFVDEQRQPRREYLAGIENGAFKTSVPPGPLRVEIRAYKRPENPSLDDGPYPQIIPARYNDASELKVELKPGESKKLEFDLTSEES